MRLFTSIVNLFSTCCPFAICWLIIPIVINAFDSKAMRRISHIKEKCTKLFPTFTNYYSASSIILISRTMGIITSLYHCGPNIVNQSMSHAMSYLSDSIRFPTTTRFSRIPRKTFSEDSPCRTTIALAQILYLIVFIIIHPAEYFNSRKSFSGKVDKFHCIHNNMIGEKCQIYWRGNEKPIIA